MLILSLDSAGPACSAAVWQDGEMLSLIEKPMDRGQDQHLMPLILDVMKKSAKSFEKLDAIAVTKGPGSFTGLRIGLAAAKGISLASAKPAIGIDRFSIYRAQKKTDDKNLLVVLASKRAELYCQFYSKENKDEPSFMMPFDEIVLFLNDHPETDVMGDEAACRLPHFIPAQEKEVLISASLAAKVKGTDILSEKYLPRPLYLRAPDVTLKKKKAS